MRIAFMGAPAFALPTLAELVAARHEIAMVYTQPPRPAGRGQAERPGPVHALAVELGLPVRTPASFKSAEEQAAFAALGLDIAVVVAYGLILPPAMLAAPRLGCVNLHASLLPRWRGAAPIQRAVMAGDEVTGVEVMQMTPGLDEGPILLSETVRIFPFDTAGSLHDRLAEVGAQLMARALAALERGALAPTPQASDGVTYAKKIDKAEARIDWARPAVEIDRQIRGLSPFPGAWFELARDGGKPMRVKALACRLEPDAEVGAAAPGAAAPGAAAPGAATPGEATPGEALDDRLLIATADGAVRLTRLQREGRRAQEADEFLRGAPTPAGTRLA